MGFLFSKVVRNIVIAYVIFSGIQYLLRWKSYSISPKEFKNIAAKSISKDNAVSSVNRLASELQRAYKDAIVPDAPWVAITMGGLDIKATFLHASISEYIAVFGSPFAASGRIGMHWSNSTCTVLSGTVNRIVDSHNLNNKETFNAGGNFRHGQFESSIYSLADDTYVTCYGRGVMPISGLWSITGALSHGEPLSLFHLSIAYGQAALHQTTLAVTKVFNHYKAKATGAKSEL